MTNKTHKIYVTKKNKTFRNNDLYKISIPLKKKKIIVPVFNKKLSKKLNKPSVCSDIIIVPFQKEFEKRHKILMGLDIKEQIKLNTNLLDLDKEIPINIRPNTDYYTYINYKWLQQQRQVIGNTKTYYFKIDSFRVIQDKIYAELKEYIEKYIKENSTQRKVKNLSNLYNSLVNVDKYSGIENGLEMIKKVEEYIKNDDLTLFLAYINSNELVSYKSPIWWTLQPDTDNSKIYTPNISFPQLTLDISLYFLQPIELRKNDIYKKYLNFIDEIFTTYMGKTHNINPEFVYDCEKEILMSLVCEDIKIKKNNHEDQDKPFRVSKTDSIKYGFDWINFNKYLGYKEIPSNYLTGSINYIKCVMDKLNKDWKTPKWKAYWLYIFLFHTIRYSKERFVFWKFIRKELQGDQLLTPGSRSFIFGLSLGYNRLLTELYCEKFPRIDEIAYVKTLSNDLKLVLINMINKNKWLMPNTKREALLKIKYLNFIYGSPKITIDDPDLEYNNNNVWENLTKLSAYRVSLWIKLTNKNVINISTVDWKEQSLTGSQAYIVNAFYTSNRNDIFIPQAILQKPFIDLENRGIEYNLAFIGFTLCHEMSHALDKIGGRYDYKGNLRYWWSNQDKKIFDKKNNNIVKQYELFAKRDGIKLDGNLGVGENLADINGCNILTEYLRNFQEQHHDSIYIRELSFKAFFAYYAIQGRQVIYKDAIDVDVATSPHPLEKYRVNCVLARNHIFKIIYNIKKNDPMYWNVNDFW